MRYHVICEEEREKTKIIRPRIDSVVEAENIDQAENIVCARFPAYKKVRVYKLNIAPKRKD